MTRNLLRGWWAGASNRERGLGIALAVVAAVLLGAFLFGAWHVLFGGFVRGNWRAGVFGLLLSGVTGSALALVARFGPRAVGA